MSHLLDRVLSHPVGTGRRYTVQPNTARVSRRGGECGVDGKDTKTGDPCIPTAVIPQATPPPISTQGPGPSGAAPQATAMYTPEKRPDCTYGRRLPTWQIVAVFMYLLIMLIGVVIVIAYWNPWWTTNKIYILLAILGIVIFLVLAIVTAVLAPCAPPPGDKQ